MIRGKAQIKLKDVETPCKPWIKRDIHQVLQSNDLFCGMGVGVEGLACFPEDNRESRAPGQLQRGPRRQVKVLGETGKTQILLLVQAVTALLILISKQENALFENQRVML